MDRWEIRPAPNADDPQRHLLLLHGGASDVAALLKKFGALCGRPTPLDGEEFNLSFALHKVTPEVRKKLNDWLGKMSPKPAPIQVPAPAPFAPPMSSFAAPVDIDSPKVKDPPFPMLDIPPASTLPPPKEPLISLGPEVVATPPSPAPAMPKFTLVAAPAASASAASPQANQPVNQGKDTSMALTDELRADLTFETLLVGAYNRFAHAAAMSVVTSPGSMYNPLFLYGVPGTGKTHLLFSIANSMSKGLGTASMLVTSGARLSRVVSAAIASGSMAAIDKKVADSKSIFVDDIHLLAVTDQNKDVLAKLFKSFFDRSLQVVITSMYPPKALALLRKR